MRFEEQVTVLCADALAADDDAQVGKILTELRLVLHQHIEKLRRGLRVAYTSTMIHANSVEDTPQGRGNAKIGGAPESLPTAERTLRPWQQVVHEIADETDFRKALRLSLELTRFLQSQTDPRTGADSPTR
jgi:hypothetical protein